MLKAESALPTVRLVGELIISNAASVLKESDAWLVDGVETVDLSGVTESDSAALALLLEWQKRRPSIWFAGAPESMLSVAKLSNLDELLRFR